MGGEMNILTDEELAIVKKIATKNGMFEVKQGIFQAGEAPHEKRIDTTQESITFPGMPAIGIKQGIEILEQNTGIGVIETLQNEIHAQLQAHRKKKTSSAYPKKSFKEEVAEKPTEEQMKKEEPKLKVPICGICKMETNKQQALHCLEINIPCMCESCEEKETQKMDEALMKDEKKYKEVKTEQPMNDSNIPAKVDSKVPAKKEEMTDAQRDAMIEKAKASRYIQNQGGSYKVSGKERPDAAQIQHFANEFKINIEILKAEQTKEYAEVIVRGRLGNQVMDAIVHHDFETIYLLRIMEIAKKYPHIIDRWEGTNPVLKGDAMIPSENPNKPPTTAQYYISHTLLQFKNFALRDAMTKASSIVQLKLLNREWRDDEEIESEEFERQLVEDNKKRRF